MKKLFVLVLFLGVAFAYTPPESTQAILRGAVVLTEGNIVDCPPGDTGGLWLLCVADSPRSPEELKAVTQLIPVLSPGWELAQDWSLECDGSCWMIAYLRPSTREVLGVFINRTDGYPQVIYSISPL